MINLLAPDTKKQLVASRTNSLLLRYNIALLGSFTFLLLALGVTYVYLSSTQANAQNLIDENQAKASSYSAVAKEATTLKTNLTTAKQILDKEVAYTKAILAISKLVPKGVVLQNLNLDVATFGTQSTLTAQAKDTNGAIKLKDSFQKSSLFSDVHFQSIVTNDTDTDYPVTVNLNVTISKDAAK